jgi:outer membrane cobalamin receptor
VSSVSDDVSKTLVSVASNFRAPTFADYAAERGERTNQIQIDHSRLWGDSLLNLSVTKARTPNKMLQGNSTGGQPGGENRINFAEVGINTFAWGTDLKLSYAYTDSRLKEKNWTRMPFVPDHVFRLGGAITTGHGKTNIEAVSQTGFFTDYFEPANSRQSGFTDVNLSYAMQISDSLQVKAQIENLLDRSVQYSFAGTTQQRFELPGRSFMLSLSGQF